jgi:septal ring factor EnvC (AmiA/AmiB activator)
MDKLIKQVRVARRRLMLQRFLAALVACLFVTWLAAAVAIGVQKWLLTNIEGGPWAVRWIGGAAIVAILAALGWTWLRRLPELEAAVEIDHRFGLQERVSSAVALSAEELQTPFGQALAEDARRRIDQLAVRGRFPIVLERRAWLPVLPAAVAFALCLLADPTRPTTTADASANTVAVKKQIDESVQPLKSKFQERAKQAADAGLKDAEDLFKKLEAGTRELAKQDDADRHETTSKLNDLAQQLEHRREQLSEGEKLKDQLAAMKSMSDGPADKLAQDLKQGNFDQALKELEKLQAQLSPGQLSPEEQKKLIEQLKSMQQAMQKIAEAHDKTEESLQQQLTQAQQAGNKEAASKLQKQLQKLAQQQQQMGQLRHMAEHLGACSQCLQAGDARQAQAALSQMAQEVAASQQELAELQMLDAAMDEIDEAKFAINSPVGNEGHLLNQNHEHSTKPGSSAGGEGQVPEALQGTKFYDSKVSQQLGKGSALITGLVNGPNAKGQVMEEIKSEVESAKHDSADPLTGQHLPRQERDHVQEYFDAFRQGP